MFQAFGEIPLGEVHVVVGGRLINTYTIECQCNDGIIIDLIGEIFAKLEFGNGRIKSIGVEAGRTTVKMSKSKVSFVTMAGCTLHISQRQCVKCAVVKVIEGDLTLVVQRFKPVL